MAKNYTENDLLLYLYGEMGPEEAKEMEAALSNQTDLQLALNNLKAGMAVMKQLEADPSPTSVALILEYSQKTAGSPVETH